MKFWRVTESFVEMRVAMVVNLVVHALESHHLRVDRLGEIMYDHCCAKTKKKKKSYIGTSKQRTFWGQ